VAAASPPRSRYRGGVPADTAGAETLADGDGAPAGQRGPRDGDSIGRYVVVGTLGAGGMGVVLRAHDPQLDRPVAVKLLHPQFGGQRPEHRARLLREAEAMAQLAHPNVVTVYDVGTYRDQVFLAMELVTGRTLADWLAEGERSWREIVDVFAAAARGLEAAHAEGVVHRDFKPDNVMIGDDGRVRVMDFGLARATTQSDVVGRSEPSDRLSTTSQLSRPLTRVGAVLGTPAYMAPEQLIGAAAGPHSDQFSFCVALYEALYGARPFQAVTVPELLTRITEGQMEPRPAGRSVPNWLHRIVHRGLAISVDERFASMTALRRALERRPRRRRWVAGLLAAPIVAGGVGVLRSATDEGNTPAQCELASARIDAIWNDDARRRVREALWSAPKPFTARLATAVDERITGYADAWRETRRDVCLTTSEREVGTARAAEECLADRAAALRDLVEVLASGDEATNRRGLVLASGLRGPRPCGDPAFVARRQPLPADFETRMLTVIARRRLAQAALLSDAGDFDAALARVRRVERLTARLGYRPLEIDVGAAHGQLLSRLGRTDEALEVLSAAFYDALAIGYDRRVAWTGIALLDLLGDGLARAEEAEVWARHASAAIERLQEQDGLLGGDLQSNLGTLMARREDWPRATSHLRRALEIKTASLGSAHPAVAQALNDLGVAMLRSGQDGEAAVAHLQQAWELLASGLGAEHPDTVSAQANLGAALGTLGHHEDALRHGEAALARRRAELGDDHPSVAASLANVATVHRRLGHLERARALWGEALLGLRRAWGPDHRRVVIAHGALAELHDALGEPDRALVHYAEIHAIVLASRTADDRERQEVEGHLERLRGKLADTATEPPASSRP